MEFRKEISPYYPDPITLCETPGFARVWQVLPADVDEPGYDDNNASDTQRYGDHHQHWCRCNTKPYST